MKSIFSILSVVPDHRMGNHLVYSLDYILLVTAYIAGLKVALDGVFISKKSIEINAIKELFDLIDIKGQTVTIDAIGTRTSIVDKITEKEADYILNVKSNQKGTLLETDGLFKPICRKEIVRTISEECGHGCVETRLMESIIDSMRFSGIEQYVSLNKWQNMRSVHKMTRVRYDKRTGKFI